MTSETKDAEQKDFDQKYITSSEIMGELNLSRSSVHTARRTGKLPGAVYVQGQIYIWERKKIRPYLDAWKMVLNVRRGVSV